MSAVRAVMYFVADPARCGAWWAEHLGASAALHAEPGGFHWFETDGVELGFHPADEERNPAGASAVVYHGVDNLDAWRARLLAAGCTLHRGPLVVGPHRRICQLTDPFGNTFGIDGP